MNFIKWSKDGAVWNGKADGFCFSVSPNVISGYDVRVGDTLIRVSTLIDSLIYCESLVCSSGGNPLVSVGITWTVVGSFLSGRSPLGEFRIELHLPKPLDSSKESIFEYWVSFTPESKPTICLPQFPSLVEAKDYCKEYLDSLLLSVVGPQKSPASAGRIQSQSKMISREIHSLSDEEKVVVIKIIKGDDKQCSKRIYSDLKRRFGIERMPAVVGFVEEILKNS